MSKDLLDYKGQSIPSEDIIKRENLITKEVALFKYISINEIKGTLYILNENKEISENNLSNINVDNGTSLVNDNTFRWSKLLNFEE